MNVIKHLISNEKLTCILVVVMVNQVLRKYNRIQNSLFFQEIYKKMQKIILPQLLHCHYYCTSTRLFLLILTSKVCSYKFNKASTTNKQFRVVTYKNYFTSTRARCCKNLICRTQQDKLHTIFVSIVSKLKVIVNILRN